MLNENIMDSKDKEIAKLNILIERYKKYDAKRMEYVRELEQKYSELKTEYDKSESCELQEKYKNLRKQYSIACRKLQIMQCPDVLEEFDEKQLKDMNKLANLKKEISDLKKQNKELKRTNDDLMYKLNTK